MNATGSLRRRASGMLGVLLMTITLVNPGEITASPGLPEERAGPAAAPSLWVTPLEFDFGVLGVGNTSAPQVVTITNTGNDLLTEFVVGAVDPPFTSFQNCAGGVPPGGSCQHTFFFSPTEIGAFTATSSSSSNAGPFTIRLLGAGAGAGLAVSPLWLDFGSVFSGTSSAQQRVTIRNVGLAMLTNFVGGGVYPPFSGVQDCTPGVPPGGSCQYTFEFAPTAAGTYTTTSFSSTNAGDFTVTLQGEGRTELFGTGQRVTPRALDFGPVGVGAVSATQTVTVTNQSPYLPITDFSGGGVSPPFQATQNCTPELPPGESCRYTFSFSPQAVGIFTETSTTTDSVGSFTVVLRGTGVGAGLSVSPLSLDFGPVPVGGTSEGQVVTIRNTGMATLTDFLGGGVSPPFSGVQNCSEGVAPGGSCEYTFYFSPTTGGRFSATSDTSTNGGAFSVQLQGGVSPPSLVKSFLPATIPPEGVSTLQLAVTNPNPAATLYSVTLTDTLPAGMTVAAPLTFSVSPECGTPTFAPLVAAQALFFKDGTIMGSETCLVNVNVTAGERGSYVNTTSPVSSTSGDGNPAMATLQVGFLINLPILSR